MFYSHNGVKLFHWTYKICFAEPSLLRNINNGIENIINSHIALLREQSRTIDYFIIIINTYLKTILIHYEPSTTRFPSCGNVWCSTAMTVEGNKTTHFQCKHNLTSYLVTFSKEQNIASTVRDFTPIYVIEFISEPNFSVGLLTINTMECFSKVGGLEYI